MSYNLSLELPLALRFVHQFAVYRMKHYLPASNLLTGGRGIFALPAGAVWGPRHVRDRQPWRLVRARSQYAPRAHKPSLQKKR